MTKSAGSFDYTMTKQGSPWMPSSYVEICVREWGRMTRDGAPVVSRELSTEEEIDNCIADIKAELDAVGFRAKRALAEMRGK